MKNKFISINTITKKQNMIKIIVLIMVMIIVLYLMLMKGNKIPEETGVNTTKIYRDPGNYFSIDIPSNWVTDDVVAQETHNIGKADETTTDIETVSMSSENKMGLNIQVYEKIPTCENAPKPNSTIANLPAYHDQLQNSWLISTTESTVVISYYYPGSGIYHSRIKNATTPVPQAEKDKSQNIINSIISTFKLQSAQPLQCE